MSVDDVYTLVVFLEATVVSAVCFRAYRKRPPRYAIHFLGGVGSGLMALVYGAILLGIVPLEFFVDNYILRMLVMIIVLVVGLQAYIDV